MVKKEPRWKGSSRGKKYVPIEQLLPPRLYPHNGEYAMLHTEVRVDMNLLGDSPKSWKVDVFVTLAAILVALFVLQLFAKSLWPHLNYRSSTSYVGALYA